MKRDSRPIQRPITSMKAAQLTPRAGQFASDGFDFGIVKGERRVERGLGSKRLGSASNLGNPHRRRECLQRNSS